MSSSLVQLTAARVREFIREPEAVFWTFFFPILLAFALGIAFRGDAGTEPVPVAVEEGPGARELLAALSDEGAVRARLLSADSAGEALRRGEVAVSVAAGADGVVYRYDPTRPDSRLARLVLDDALQAAAGRHDPLAVRESPVRERGSRYIDFLIPGLIGLNLLSTGLWGVGFAVVKMRSDHLLKRLMATPMRRWEFLLSFMLGRLAFLAAEMAVLLVFAWLAFDVVVRGSLLTLAATATLGAFTFTGVGLLVASRARTLEGVSGLMNLASVPQWILSGVFFSTERFPEVIQPLVALLPLTALVDALRAVMTEAAGVGALVVPTAIVLAWGVLSYAVALSIFRWR